MFHLTEVLPILKVRQVIVIGIGLLFKGYLIICLHPATSRLNKFHKKFADIPKVEANAKHLTALSDMYALMIDYPLAQRFALRAGEHPFKDCYCCKTFGWNHCVIDNLHNCKFMCCYSNVKTI